MPQTFASLGLDGLSVDEKLELVGQLWEDLVASTPPGALLSEAQKEELRRRVKDAGERPNDWVAWEDALAATTRRLSE
jgi:putative addiction module component (TIGR02574 family)